MRTGHLLWQRWGNYLYMLHITIMITMTITIIMIIILIIMIIIAIIMIIIAIIIIIVTMKVTYPTPCSTPAGVTCVDYNECPAVEPPLPPGILVIIIGIFFITIIFIIMC